MGGLGKKWSKEEQKKGGGKGQKGGRRCNSVRVQSDGESWPMRRKSEIDAGNWDRLRLTSNLFNLHFVVHCYNSFTYHLTW